MCALFHECQDGPWLQQIKSVSRAVAFQPLQILEVENFRSPSVKLEQENVPTYTAV